MIRESAAASLESALTDWKATLSPLEYRALHEDSADRPHAQTHRLQERELQASPARKSVQPPKRDTGEAVNSFEEFLKTKNLFDMSLNALFEERPGSQEIKEQGSVSQSRLESTAKEEERKARAKLAGGLSFESRLTKNAIEYFKKKRNPGELSKKPKHSSNLTENRSLRQDYSATHKPARPSPSISKASDRSWFKSQADTPAPPRPGSPASQRKQRTNSSFCEKEPHFTSVRHEDGSVYTGYLLNKLRQGRGLLRLQDGSKYEGDWDAGKMSGYGTLTYSDGRTAFRGCFCDNKPNGLGCMYTSAPATSSASRKKIDYRDFSDVELDWRSFEGIFLDGKKHGLGKLSFRNGEMFVGHFEDDKISGLGKFISPVGTVLGFWANNILIRRLN